MSAATAMTTIDDVDDTGDVIETTADVADHIEEDPQPPSPDDDVGKEGEDAVEDELQDEGKDEEDQPEEEAVSKDEEETALEVESCLAAPALQLDGKSLKRNSSVGNSASWILRLFESQVFFFTKIKSLLSLKQTVNTQMVLLSFELKVFLTQKDCAIHPSVLRRVDGHCVLVQVQGARGA